MTPRNLMLGLAFVAIGLVAALWMKQKSDAPKVEEKKEASAAHGGPKDAGAVPQADPNKVLPPPNNKELNRLNAMQSEIAQLSDEDLSKEIDTVRAKAETLGLLKGGTKPQNFDMNANPEAKDVLMRMALLRVEKAKRDRKQQTGAAAAKKDS